MATFTSVHSATDHTGITGVGGGTPTFVGWMIQHDAAQAVANNSLVLLSMNTETVDTNTFHSTVTNNERITVPSGKAGKYFVTAHVEFASNATGYREVGIRINGTTYVTITRVQAANGDTTRLVTSTIVTLAEADYLEVLARQTSGGSLNVNGASGSYIACNFRGHLVGT